MFTHFQQKHVHTLSTKNARLKASDSYLLIWGNDGTTTNWDIFTFDFASDQVISVKAGIPAGFSLEKWYSAPLTNAITLVDNEGSRSPERSVIATFDGGNSWYSFFSHGSAGDDTGMWLSRGFAVTAQEAYISLKSSSLGKSEIRKTVDGGTTWTTVFTLDYAADFYFQMDGDTHVWAVLYSNPSSQGIVYLQ